MEETSEWSYEQREENYKDGEGYGFYADHLISHGVTVQKKEEKIKFLPCKCGKNSHIEWCSPGGFSFECKYCGLQSPVGRTKTEARRLWNEMVCGAEGPKEGEHG